MTDNQVIPPPQPPSEAEKTESILIKVTKQEKEMLDSLASIFSQLNTQNNTTVIKDNSLGELARMCLGFTCNTYQFQIFPDSNVISKLATKKAKKEFIAYRQKYMNIPVDAQLADLRRLGLVKTKQAQT